MDSVSETKENLLQSLTDYRAVACQMNARNKALEDQIRTLQHEIQILKTGFNNATTDATNTRQRLQFSGQIIQALLAHLSIMQQKQCEILDVLGQMTKNQATKPKEPEKMRLGNLTYTDLDASEKAEERPTYTFQQIIERAEASQKRKFTQMNVPAPPRRIIKTPMMLQHAKGPILDADSGKATPPKRMINTPMMLQHAKGPILDADSGKAKIISNQPFVCLDQKDKDAAENN